MTVMKAERQDVSQPDLTTNLPTSPRSRLPSNSTFSNDNQPVKIETDIQTTKLKERSKLKDESLLDVQHTINAHTPPNNNKYQVYSLHSIELCKQPMFPLTATLKHINKPTQNKEHFLLKSISKDSSLSSIESLPDPLGSLMSNIQQQDRISYFWNSENEGDRRSRQSENSLRSDCESGIVSDNGDSETSTNYGVQEKKEDEKVQKQEKRGQKKGEVIQEHHSFAPEMYNITHCKKRKKEICNNLEEWRRKELRGETKINEVEVDKKGCKEGGGEAVEIQISGHGILTPAKSDSDFDITGLKEDSKIFTFQSDNTEFNIDPYKGLETLHALNSRIPSPVLSQSSSLESLLALGIELFPSKERLHHSISLESCLNPCRSPDRAVVGSFSSPNELNHDQEKDTDRVEQKICMNTESETPTGELSQRTLDLLKRLENIENPLVGKMTRSVSDMSVQSHISERNQFPVSPSLGGQHTPLSESTTWKGQPSLINENVSKLSLTELSSKEDSSLGSEDCIMLRNQHHLILDSTMAASSHPRRKHRHNSNRGGKGVDESDAVNLSMVVNISCTSACTDEDEDDSDLLSSSTLTLTEEELGVRDEQDGDDERVNGVSSDNEEDEDNDKDDMENSCELGLEYMKRELQSWIRSPRSCASSSFKPETGLLDELQCGITPSSTFTYSSTQLKETNSKAGSSTSRKDKEDHTQRVTRSYISQFVDDVENGNVDHNCLQRKDEDDVLLQEESGLFTKKRDALRDFYVSTKTEEPVQDVGNLRAEMDSFSTGHIFSSPTSEFHPFSSKHSSCLVGELKGELPCHSTPLPPLPLLSPVDYRSHNLLDNSLSTAGGRKAITIQEKFKFSSLVTEETKREVRAKDSSLPSKKGQKSYPSCCNPSLMSPHPLSVEKSKKEHVHDFVMEIIGMASVALKNKKNLSDGGNQSETGGSIQDQFSTSLAHIRDKVEFLFYRIF